MVKILKNILAVEVKSVALVTNYVLIIFVSIAGLSNFSEMIQLFLVCLGHSPQW
jgi:hypothetical protein